MTAYRSRPYLTSAPIFATWTACPRAATGYGLLYRSEDFSNLSDEVGEQLRGMDVKREVIYANYLLSRERWAGACHQRLASNGFIGL
jgi:hypothetical protein